MDAPDEEVNGRGDKAAGHSADGADASEDCDDGGDEKKGKESKPVFLERSLVPFANCDADIM